MLKIEFKNKEKVKGNFEKKKRDIRLATKQGVFAGGGTLLKESIKECPHDKGGLSGTGTVGDVKESGSVFSVQVGYNKIYAVRLHEHPEYKFQKNKKGKYLEDPLKRFANRFSQGLSKFIMVRL